MLTVKARALCPYGDATAVGARGYISPPWYQARGATYFVNLGQPLSMNDVTELNQVGGFINRSFVIAVVAILEETGVVPNKTAPDRRKPGGDHVRLLKRLRNHFAHGEWQYDAGKQDHRMTRTLLEQLLPAAAHANGFVYSIDTALEPLKDGVLTYIRATT